MARILVLEDSLLSRQILKKILRVTAHEIVEAGNGTEGLKIIASQPIDCILLDLGMPEMNGEEVLATLQKQQSSIPTIVISADIQTTTRQRCLELGAFAVLHKMVNSSDLLDTVQRAIAASGSDASPQ